MPIDDTPAGRDGKPGRPTKLTVAVLLTAVQLTLRGNHPAVIAKACDVSIQAYRRWMRLGERHREQFPRSIYVRFRKAVLLAEATWEASAVHRIAEAGKDDPKFLCWLLERKYPQRWGRHRGEFGELKRRIRDLEKLIGEQNDDDDPRYRGNHHRIKH